MSSYFFFCGCLLVISSLVSSCFFFFLDVLFFLLCCLLDFSLVSSCSGVFFIVVFFLWFFYNPLWSMEHHLLFQLLISECYHIIELWNTTYIGKRIFIINGKQTGRYNIELIPQPSERISDNTSPSLSTALRSRACK